MILNAGVPLEADPMTLYYLKVDCKSQGVGDKNPQKMLEIFGSAIIPRQDVKHKACLDLEADLLWGWDVLYRLVWKLPRQDLKP